MLVPEIPEAAGTKRGEKRDGHALGTKSLGFQEPVFPLSNCSFGMKADLIYCTSAYFIGHGHSKPLHLWYRSPLELVLSIPLDRLELELVQLHAGRIVLQRAIYLISRLDRADTGRRAGQDHITCLEERKRLAIRV